MLFKNTIILSLTYGLTWMDSPIKFVFKGARKYDIVILLLKFWTISLHNQAFSSFSHYFFVEISSSTDNCMLQIADFFDATTAGGADIKLAANWIMGDIAAYMKNEKVTINEIKLTPQELGELIASIKDETISGKIGKEVNALWALI